MIDTSTEAVKALMDGVTAGPWTEHNAGKHPYVYVCGPDQLYYNGEVTDKPLVAYVTGVDAIGNRAFIAAARDLVPALLSERDDLRSKMDAAVEALTPSGDTKAEYMGEFSFSQTMIGEDGDDVTVKTYVPWSTIKEIMSAILARATLAQIKETNHG